MLAKGDGIADVHSAFPEHARVQPAPAGIRLLRDLADLPALERAGDVVAGRGVGGQLDAHLADVELCAGNHFRPRDAAQREVLADRSGADRMPFALQRGDQLLREEADGAIGPAVIAQVALAVAAEPVDGDCARGQGAFRHAALRDVDRNERCHYRAASTARVTSDVRAVPPRSGVNTFFAVTASIAFISRAAVFVSPR